MYDVYINHFNRDGNIVDTEELMFSVPDIGGFPVTKPVVRSSEDSADQFSFSMESNSPYYDSILPKKTTIRVVYDGDIIFFGPAMAPSTSTVFQTKNVTCVGKYTYLNDTYYEGKQEKHRDKITISEFLNRIISNHNTMAPTKPVVRGNIGVTLPSKVDKYEPSAWTQSSSLLSNLTSNYGGHIRARYTAGNNLYIDWYKYYLRDLGNDNRPQVTVGKNILDISSETDVNNIFTRVIPIGDTDKNGKAIYLDGFAYTDKYGTRHTYSGKVVPVSFIRDIYTNAQLTDEFHDFRDYANAEANYGIIYKTMTFSDCDTQAKLFDAVTKWIKESYFGLVPSFTVKAVDLHIQDTDVPKILLGDCVDVTYLIPINGELTSVTKKLVCKTVSYDLFNPENNTYTFSIPSDLLEYNRNNKKSTKNANNVSGIVSQKPIPKAEEDNTWTWRKIWHEIGNLRDDPDYTDTEAAISFKNNGELSGSKRCYDPNEVIDGNGTTIGNNYKDHQDKWFTCRIVGKITLPGKTVKWVAVCEDRGVFAYVDTGDPSPVTYWYFKEKGAKYEPENPGLSSFDKIAEIIEKDPDANWGGSAAATSFRNNGKISGSVNKCYDPNKCTRAQAISNKKNQFSAEMVGKFTLNNVLKYVVISKEYGIFGYDASAEAPVPATHWYMQAKGLTYDNLETMIQNEEGDVYSTDDDTPDGKKTVWIKTKELTGRGSQGEVLIGYDTTSPGDNWRIKLNVPVQYKDATGAIKIADGFVSASDFNLESVPSFKTQVGVFDVAISGCMKTVDFEADIAHIREIYTNSVSVDNYVSAKHFNSAFLYASTSVTSPHFLIESEDSGVNNFDLTRCFSGLLIQTGTGDDEGKIIFQFSRADGTVVTPKPNFNMADTQFYKDRVAAAWNNGGKTAYLKTTSTGPLNPGGYATLSVYYKNNNGNETRSSPESATGHYSNITIRARSLSLETRGPIIPTKNSQEITAVNSNSDGMNKVIIAGDANFIESNIKTGVTIWGKTGNYTGSSNASDIQLYAGGVGDITRSTSAPSGATALTSLSSQLIYAYENAGGAGQYVKFPATINGGTGVKYYYIDMSH